MATVIGIGNPSRGDDGIGHAVIDALPPLPGSRCLKLSGEATELMDTFDDDLVVIVDAMQGAGAGEVRVFDAASQALPGELVHASTHSFGLAQAVDLARALGQLPRELWVVGVAGEDFDYGMAISSAARDAIPDAVERILKFLGAENA